jgi:hypothetical protein
MGKKDNMNVIELTKLFVDYAEATKKADELKAQIETAVLEIGESQKIAGVSATYYKPGFEMPDYATAAKNANPAPEIVAKYSTTTTTTKWAEVCKELGIEAQPGAEKPARVTVRV